MGTNVSSWTAPSGQTAAQNVRPKNSVNTSGNAKNVCAAIQAADARGMRTIGLTGEPGGPLSDLAEIVIRAPAAEVHRVQQYHLPIYHCLCLMLEDAFFG